MKSKITSIKLSHEEATFQFAQGIAPILHAGDTLLLDGQIGTGKTFFARSLIRTLLGRDEDIPSPTFTLVQTYEAANYEIWHCDLYRLTTPEDIFELGLEDALNSSVCLIEWSNRLGEDIPESALQLTFESSQSEHSVTLAGDKNWHSRLKFLHD